MKPSISVVVFLIAQPAFAFYSASNDSAAIELDGNVRMLGAFLHYEPWPAPLTTPGDDEIGAVVARLIAGGHLPWAIDFDGNFYLDLEHGVSGQAGGAFSTASSFVSPYRTKYLAWNFWNKDAVSGELAVDRLRIHRTFANVDVDIGRFPVNHSVTFLFTPNDFFAPFSATTLNRDYKPGVDAARVRAGIGDKSNLEILGVLGNDTKGAPAWSQSAILLRADTTFANFQWAVLGGKLAERWAVGGSLQGDIHGVSLRAEGHAGFPDRDGNAALDAAVFGRAAARVEYSWAWHQASVGAEYAFFSDGAASPAGYIARIARFFPDDLPYLGQHYTGANASLQLIAILTANALTMINCEDGSGIVSLSLDYNAANEVDLLAGMIAGWGTQPSAAPDGTIELHSELGLTPLAAFVEVHVSF